MRQSIKCSVLQFERVNIKNQPSDETGTMSGNQRADRDNHANQLNPNNNAFHQSRGESGRPNDWDNKSYSGNPSTPSDRNNHANQLNPNNAEYDHSRQAGGNRK